MFHALKQLFAPTNKDLRKRILFTLGALMVFVIGTKVRVPGTTDLAGNLGFLELINAMGGGALRQFSIFALGVMPYITAQIIMQLLQMDIIPYFSELAKEGPVGRQKINQITRYVGIIFAFIEGFAFSFAFLGTHVPVLEHLYVATILTAGTAFTLWLGDQITQKGLGNGISLIIMAGIVETLPTMFAEAFQGLVLNNSLNNIIGILLFIAFVIVYFIIIIGVIFVEEANRKIPIQYANKSSSAYGAEQSFMPIKINSAGVVPVIFASSLLAIPATIAQFINNTSFTNFVNNYLNYTTPVGFIIYVVLIFLFGYVYTFIQIKPDEMAKNLQNNGGYIPGIRPGKDTEKYVSKVLSRLTVVGSTFLTIITILPIVFSALINLAPNVSLSSSVTVGGTGLLIVVGVCLETYKQLEGSLVTRNYSRGYSRR
ncbi:MAG: preprotein translocase subunit SecY [Candidatus Faecenecus gallistercoris]|nr:preprotein translocase subunit SecY [Bacillota bacterium]MDD7102807.1 preprotein translocase subunit SecY [Bacillota bacterium]MDY4050408.1 preprotein translocase subunit SecY [Candidatus Faecenecus gallistercoris]